MNRLFVVLFGFCLAFGWAWGGELVGRVTRVSDGDTLWVTDARGVRAKVRLDRIDAPESDQPWGKESAAYLKGLVDGKSVKVEWRKHDQYGRYLGIIWLNGRDINLHMVETGNAWHYSYYDKTPAYAAAEVAAREARKGLWADEGPINPYRWRKGERTCERLVITDDDAMPGPSVSEPVKEVAAGGSEEFGAEYRNVVRRPQEEETTYFARFREEYFAGRGPISERVAAPVCAKWPDTGYWLNTNTDARHNRRCPNYRKTRGYPCSKDEGRPCGKCGG